MPECRRGNKCTTPGCIYKHTPDEEKEECANYRLGFCPFGSMCRFRHVMRPPAELPPIADIWTPEYIAEARGRKKGVEEPHKFRVSMCPVIGKLGFCSFFDMCSYAHVPEQLRQHLQQPGFGGGFGGGGRFGGHGVGFKRGRDGGFGGGGGGPGGGGGAPVGGYGNYGPTAHSSSADGSVAAGDAKRSRGDGDAAGGGAGSSGSAGSAAAALGPAIDVDAPTATMRNLLQQRQREAAVLELPDEDDPAAAAAAAAAGLPPPGGARYFVVRTKSVLSLAVSLRRSEWICTRGQAAALLDAMEAGASSILLLFSMLGSQHFQGMALVRAQPESVPSGTPLAGNVADAAAPGGERPATPDDLVCVPVQWLRTCALNFSATAGVVNTAGIAPPPPPAGGVSLSGQAAVAEQQAHASYAAALERAPQVARAGDWAALAPGAGRCMTLLMYKAEEVAVPLAGIPATAAFEVFTAETPSGKAAVAADTVPAEIEASEREQVAAAQKRLAQAAAIASGLAAGLSAAAARALVGADGPGTGSGGPGGSTGAAAEKGLPPILVLPSLTGGTPANEMIARLMSGGAPPGAGVTPPVLAAQALMAGGRPGYLFGINNLTAAMCLESGVFPVPEDLADASRVIAPGTPVLAFNIHKREIYGLFLARTPAVRDLVPRGVFPTLGRGGGRDGGPMVGPDGQPRKPTTFPIQCQSMLVANAPPMPQPAFEPFLGSRPSPGPIAPQIMFQIAVAMFNRLPPPAVLRITGLLLQMQAMGQPQGDLIPLPASHGAHAAGGGGGAAAGGAGGSGMPSGAAGPGGAGGSGGGMAGAMGLSAQAGSAAAAGSAGHGSNSGSFPSAADAADASVGRSASGSSFGSAGAAAATSAAGSDAYGGYEVPAGTAPPAAGAAASGPADDNEYDFY